MPRRLQRQTGWPLYGDSYGNKWVANKENRGGLAQVRQSRHMGIICMIIVVINRGAMCRQVCCVVRHIKLDDKLIFLAALAGSGAANNRTVGAVESFTTFLQISFRIVTHVTTDEITTNTATVSACIGLNDWRLISK